MVCVSYNFHNCGEGAMIMFLVLLLMLVLLLLFLLMLFLVLLLASCVLCSRPKKAVKPRKYSVNQLLWFANLTPMRS